MEPISVLAKVAERLVPQVVELVGKALGRLLSSEDPERREATEGAIGKHLRTVASWSATFQVFWLADLYSTKETTIPLSMSMSPFARTLSGSSEREGHVPDVALLDRSQSHYLLLGVPGSGKTTTLKRLALQLLLTEPGNGDRFNFPILVRLRDLPHREASSRLHQPWSLSKEIARIFGLRYEDHHERDHSGNPVRTETQCEGRPIRDALVSLLEDLRVVLMLDGLDELHPSELRFVVDEIRYFAQQLSESRIILTSRTGTKHRAVEGLHIFCIDPLSRDQIVKISEYWTSDVPLFLEKLDAEPYAEIADRPLILLQLLFVFGRYGYLPDRPALAYRQSVRLLLKEWDASQPGLIRVSQYSTFDPDRKHDFLCELADDLICRSGKITFSRQDLVSAYRKIHKPYNLPEREAESVAFELETHTGILLNAGFDRFEFCHLSLQEYLAAEYIIRAPIGPRLKRYLRDYSAVVAVAAGLSSRVSEWLPQILLNEDLVNAFTKRSLEDFLKRLKVERPRYTASRALGIAVMSLVGTFYKDSGMHLREELDSLTAVDAIEVSIAESLPHFAMVTTVGEKDGMAELSLKFSRVKDFDLDEYRFETGFRFPSRLKLPVATLQRITERFKIQMRRVSGIFLPEVDDRYLSHNID